MIAVPHAGRTGYRYLQFNTLVVFRKPFPVGAIASMRTSHAAILQESRPFSRATRCLAARARARVVAGSRRIACGGGVRRRYARCGGLVLGGACRSGCLERG